MRRTALLALLVGLAVFVAVVAWQGVGDVLAALAVAGWGLVVVALYHAAPMSADVLAWRALFRGRRPSGGALLHARWVCDAVNALLPVVQIGGDLVRARLLTFRGVPARIAGATVIVDLTLSAFTQILFTLLGVGLLLGRFGRHEIVPAILLVLALFGGALFGFYRFQRRGMFGAVVRRLALVGGSSWVATADGAQAIDDAVTELYERPRAVARSAGWNLVSWLLGSGEVWLAMYFLGTPVTLLDAVLLESLGQAVRAAAFAIPGGLGVQEGGYLFLGGLLGLPGHVSLALSLAKRAREVFLGLPGLLAWQLAEWMRVRRRTA